MKDLRWPHVVVVLGALGVLGTLAYFEKDTAAVITGVLALLGVMGFVAYQQSEIKARVETVQSNTNGANAELLRQQEVRDQRHREEIAAKDHMIMRLQQENTELALQVPAPVPVPESESPTS